MSCTTRRSTFTQIEREFQALASGPNPLTIDGHVMHPALPDRPVPLGELRRILLSGTVGHDVKNAAWSTLVRRSREDHERWAIACAGMMLPGLRRIAADISYGYPVDSDDIDSEVLLGFLEALHTVDPAIGRIPAILWWSAKRSALRARAADLKARGRRLDDNTSHVAMRVGPVPGHPDLVLAWAVIHGVVTPEDAMLVGDTRLERQPIVHAAQRLGLTDAACRKRRSRAESRLLQFLGHPRIVSIPKPRMAAA